jgi:glycerol-3-phosphate dehydrogenase (NAD(P)+)
MSKENQIAILGAGSWGGTLAWLLGSNGKNINLLTRTEEQARMLKGKKQIDKPLAISLPNSVSVSSDLASSISNAQIILLCCTSQSLRQVMVDLDLALKATKRNDAGRAPIIVSTVKGLELKSLKRMSQVITEALPYAPVCVLSGPNLAAEILQGKPAATVIASNSLETAKTAQNMLSLPFFRIYANDDVAGVELGGALKNIIAIAAGVSDGLQLGANAKAALLARGLAEITRLAVRMGAKSSTFSGLAGMGDLFATCAGPDSRNYRLGKELVSREKGAAHGLDSILNKIGAVVEGVPTTEAVCELSKKLELDLPIAYQVNETLKGRTTAKEAITNLMTRPPSIE